ncbi:MAG: Rho termination factor N-terminal domain-containing protein [Rhodoglobus sp.]|uniref:DUF7218 family protein n=1 Tax=uncultured Salinibacterium sp. TaxID=459274 RepID=UPI0030DA249E|tara:strand:- start:910 stop:1176 length:267 start_codon:yes stop_codon:yes gene_type:complete
MPSTNNSRLKDPELYEELRSSGASKEKAARISNAAAHTGRSEIGRRGGESASYEEWTVKDLKERARELDLHGYSSLKKSELIEKLRSH